LDRNDVLNAEAFFNVPRATTLDKTLKEWEIGGNGEGVDVVR
jgi:hypothetical protein